MCDLHYDNVSRYLRNYKEEMLRYGISERLQVISFNRVATDRLQESIHGIRQENPMWGSFEEALREAYDYKRPMGRVRPMGGISEDPPKRDKSIPRLRTSLCSTIEAGTRIGGDG